MGQARVASLGFLSESQSGQSFGRLRDATNKLPEVAPVLLVNDDYLLPEFGLDQQQSSGPGLW